MLKGNLVLPPIKEVLPYILWDLQRQSKKVNRDSVVTYYSYLTFKRLCAFITQLHKKYPLWVLPATMREYSKLTPWVNFEDFWVTFLKGRKAPSPDTGFLFMVKIQELATKAVHIPKDGLHLEHYDTETHLFWGAPVRYAKADFLTYTPNSLNHILMNFKALYVENVDSFDGNITSTIIPTSNQYMMNLFVPAEAEQLITEVKEFQNSGGNIKGFSNSLKTYYP